MKFWLIQRATIRTQKSSEIKGMNSLIACDYMGSAEFEDGCTGRSLRSFFPIVDQLQVQKTGIKRQDGQGLFVISLPDQFDEIKLFLQREANGVHVQLKEPTQLERSLKQNKFDLHDINVWWDVENHWFAVLGKQNAENIIKAIRLNKENLK